MENKKKIVFWIIAGVVVISLTILTSELMRGGLLGSKPEIYVSAPGANEIKDGQVIDPAGRPARNDSRPMSDDAPHQSDAISPSEVPNSAIRLSISEKGIKPASFDVRAGEPVTLAITSDDDLTHAPRFTDPSLQAVIVLVGPGQTKIINFNGPEKGTYDVICDLPGHPERASMTVK